MHKFILLFIVSNLILVGCSGTNRSKGLTYNKVDYFNTVMDWNQKHTCLTQAGLSCWAFNERECTLNYNRYKLYCDSEWFDKYPEILNQEEAIDMHVNMTACISTMRYNDSFKRDQINESSCKYLYARENLEALIDEAQKRDRENKKGWKN